MMHPRYIALKPAGADPPNDEADYERESDFFVTALTTGPPDETQHAPFEEVRYGVDSLYPYNYKCFRRDDMDWGIPIHDSCWKIFQRVSNLRLGHVDLQGFAALWEVDIPSILGNIGVLV